MTKFFIELFIGGDLITRIIEADDVMVDGIGFLVFCNNIEGNDEEKLHSYSYNPAFIVSMTKEDNANTKPGT